MLYGLWSIGILSSCSSRELDPNDKLTGIYSEALYPKGYIRNNYFLSILNIEKKEGKRVSINVSNIAIGVTFQAIGGTVTRRKDFKCPNCEIIQIDTQGFLIKINTLIII
jgi:hypothetical protein